MNYIILSLISFYFILINIIILFSIYKIYKKIKVMRYCEKYEQYLSILNYHLERCYSIIYKDKLLVYSIEATKANETQMKEYSKDFVNLVIKMIGKNMLDIFVEIYGDDITFYTNMIEYFNDKYDNDEIRKDSIREIQNKEQI